MEEGRQRQVNRGTDICLNAHRLNSGVTQSWACCMPETDELLGKVAGAWMYIGVDGTSALHKQLPIAEKDRDKTAFWGSDRQYEWCRMALGFKNATHGWQSLMDEALGDLPFVLAVYAHDICVIFSGTYEMSERG